MIFVSAVAVSKLVHIESVEHARRDGIDASLNDRKCMEYCRIRIDVYLEQENTYQEFT